MNKEKLLEELNKLTDEERKEIFDNFCTDCGDENPLCQCTNDD